MSPLLRTHGKIIFAWFGLAIMIAMRILDGKLSAGDSTAYAEISGWIFLIVGFTLARPISDRFEFLLERLVERGTLKVGDGGLDYLIQSARRRARICQMVGSIVFAAVLIGSYLYHYGFFPEGTNPYLFWVKVGLESVGITFTGGYAGILVSYGFLGSLLRKHQAEIQVTPTHPDGAGGLRIIGDHYFYQAALVMLPVIFFAFWFVAGPIWTDLSGVSGMEDWQTGFAFFFLGMLSVEIAAFAMPLIYFHKVMRRSTTTFKRKADELGNEVVNLKKTVFLESDPDTILSIETRGRLLEDQIRALESAPTWPLNASIRKRFAWSNALVFAVPFIAKQEAVTGALKTLSPF